MREGKSQPRGSRSRMKVQTATFVASSVSAVTLVACLVAMVSIYNDVAGFWNELDSEIATFRVSLFFSLA